MKIIKSTLTAIALVVAGFVSFNAQAQLVIEPSSNYTPEELVQILVGEGVNVSNVTINCGADAYGVFNAENTTLPLNNGLILTSGTAANASEALFRAGIRPTTAAAKQVAAALVAMPTLI